MIVLKARNANQALPEMMHLISYDDRCVQRGSRNGPVVQFVEPLTIQYQKPTERVVFWEARDANPFFHLFESLWMLAGRNDVAFPTKYNSTFGQFSDDGRTFHGAYGHRWRQWFGYDQLRVIADALRANPEDRRCVLSMWDATSDLGKQGKDFPCNLQAVFNRDHDGRLNMTVYNRSNDVIWGALGANCVHFSMLQEFMAAWIGCEVGQYWQVSANMHAYTELTPLLKACLPLGDSAFPSEQYRRQDPYHAGIPTYPLVASGNVERWLSDLDMFMAAGPSAMGYRDAFFRRIACPLALAYEAFSDRSNPDRFDVALNIVNQSAPCDWKVACISWLLRRKAKAQQK